MKYSSISPQLDFAKENSNQLSGDEIPLPVAGHPSNTRGRAVDPLTAAKARATFADVTSHPEQEIARAALIILEDPSADCGIRKDAENYVRHGNLDALAVATSEHPAPQRILSLIAEVRNA